MRPGGLDLAIAGIREGDCLAKTGQKSEKPVPPQRDIDRVNSNSKPLEDTVNGNSPTVQPSETCSPYCAKCPLNGQPRVNGHSQSKGAIFGAGA